MSANMNLVVLGGNLTKDPELRYTPGGSPVARFSIAMNRRWRDAQGKVQEKPCYVDCEAWGQLGMSSERYLSKGSAVLVRGHLKFDKWTDREGAFRSKLTVVADEVQFLGSPRRAGSDAGNTGATEAAKASDAERADGLLV